jgi:hypothetical protein
VWGEQVSEDVRKASRVRVGKSRLLTDATTTANGGDVGDGSKGDGKTGSNGSVMDRQLQKQQKQQKGGHHRRDKRDSGYDSTDDSSSDDGDDGGTNRAGGSLAHLLKRIRRPASTHGDMDVSDDDDGTKTGSDDDEGEEEVDASSSDDTESDDGMDDVSPKEDFDDVASTSTDGIFQDPYEAHFSKPSLPQLDSLPSDGKSIQQQIIPYIGNSRKVNTTSLLSSSMDVQMSGSLLESWEEVDTAKNTGATTKKNKQKSSRKLWETFAKGPFLHVRQVLARNWRGVNKSVLKRYAKNNDKAEEDAPEDTTETKVGRLLTPMQLALYPAISRYADVLVTAETRQVSHYYAVLSWPA